MASEKSSRGTTGRRRDRATDDLREMVETTTDELRQLAVDAATQKIALKAARQAERVKAKAARHAAQLDRLAEHLEALDVWTRAEPSRRRPRLNREEIAATAVRIADADGLDALSMRRLAAELGAGTMTLYYYLRTKDELLALVTDAVMGEVVLPPGERLPSDWRAAITTIARRSRDALRRHQWMLDIADDPAVGPNSVRHFDQTMQAVAGLDVDFATKLDIITVVDEYVFGFCLHQRTTFEKDAAAGDAMQTYVNELVTTGEYPELTRLVETEGTAKVWAQLFAHAQDPTRFDRNLARLLDGIDHDLATR
jgi:AcrR family transcriptional regulator